MKILERSVILIAGDIQRRYLPKSVYYLSKYHKNLIKINHKVGNHVADASEKILGTSSHKGIEITNV